MVKALSMSVFFETLPIIGICLVGIFAVTALIIGVVHLLNKFSSWLESRKEQ